MSARSVLRAAALPAVATLAAAAQSSAAPVPFGGNTYDLVFHSEITWTAARDAAAASGGSLAVISSEAEQEFIESLLLDRNAETGSYWFGIQETETEGDYEAINGESLTFTNFSPGEPNNGAGGVEESVGGIYWTRDGEGIDETLLGRRGDWNDLPEQGYPNDDAPIPPEPDLFRAGYLVEFAGDGTGVGDGGGDGGIGDGVGDGGIGDGDGGGDGGGPSPIPIPAAAFMFPGTAAIAYFATRRLRRR